MIDRLDAFATIYPGYTPDNGQARWPERELQTLRFVLGSPRWHPGWAGIITQALDSHDALRERCLTAEMERDQLRARVSGSPLEQEGT